MGYKTEDEARRVKEYFDGSFGFGAGKVRVDFVKDEVSLCEPFCSLKSACCR